MVVHLFVAGCRPAPRKALMPAAAASQHLDGAAGDGFAFLIVVGAYLCQIAARQDADAAIAVILKAAAGRGRVEVLGVYLHFLAVQQPHVVKRRFESVQLMGGGAGRHLRTPVALDLFLQRAFPSVDEQLRINLLLGVAFVGFGADRVGRRLLRDVNLGLQPPGQLHGFLQRTSAVVLHFAPINIQVAGVQLHIDHAVLAKASAFIVPLFPVVELHDQVAVDLLDFSHFRCPSFLACHHRYQEAIPGRRPIGRFGSFAFGFQGVQLGGALLHCLGPGLLCAVTGDGILKKHAARVVGTYGHLVSGLSHPCPACLGFVGDHHPEVTPELFRQLLQLEGGDLLLRRRKLGKGVIKLGLQMGGVRLCGNVLASQLPGLLLSRFDPALHAKREVVLDVGFGVLEASLEGGGKVALRAKLCDHRFDFLQGLPLLVFRGADIAINKLNVADLCAFVVGLESPPSRCFAALNDGELSIPLGGVVSNCIRSCCCSFLLPGYAGITLMMFLVLWRMTISPFFFCLTTSQFSGASPAWPIRIFCALVGFFPCRTVFLLSFSRRLWYDLG